MATSIELMLPAAKHPPSEIFPSPGSTRWAASDETGHLTEVLLSSPVHLALIPCNSVAKQSLAAGRTVCSADVARQHRAFAETLERDGVRCHFVPPRGEMPDLCFTRDAALMTPWGFVQLRPKVPHRQAEADHLARFVTTAGATLYDCVDVGTIEGGDVCMVQDGLVIIGYSGERTDLLGAQKLGSLFQQRGWEVIHTRVHPSYLHLDTILTMVAPQLALACFDALEDSLVFELQQRGIGLVRVTIDEVRGLHGNCLSIGQNRVVLARGSSRIRDLLDRRGVHVIEIPLDQFTRCGGGPHCLTLPLRRVIG